MTKRYIVLLLCLFVFVFTPSCAVIEHPAPTVPAGETVPPTQTSAPSPEPTPQPPDDPIPPPDPLYQAVLRLTTEEKVGQLLVVGLAGTSPGDDARQAIEDLKVGGFILFGKNVENAAQLLSLTNGLKELNQSAGNVPLFLCVDEEGGTVSRMPPELLDLPSAYDFLQAGGDPYARGEVLAQQCAAFGFHVDFAPCLDVWSNPNNTVIGKRAFSADAKTAAVAGRDCAYGVMSGGIIPVVKHFPGHGDTDTDSHVGLPVVDKTKEALWDMELLPFRTAIADSSQDNVPALETGDPKEPIPAVMVAHILMTELDDQRPASLSPAVVTGLLREELGFGGVVFTDDLTMGAVTSTYGVGQAAVMAVEAGCDVALVCHGAQEARAAYTALLEAVNSGRISMSRLDDSVTRILALKQAYGVEDKAVEAPDIAALNARIEAVLP